MKKLLLVLSLLSFLNVSAEEVVYSQSTTNISDAYSINAESGSEASTCTYQVTKMKNDYTGKVYYALEVDTDLDLHFPFVMWIEESQLPLSEGKLEFSEETVSFTGIEANYNDGTLFVTTKEQNGKEREKMAFQIDPDLTNMKNFSGLGEFKQFFLWLDGSRTECSF